VVRCRVNCQHFKSLFPEVRGGFKARIMPTSD
jgi:hypothetical protein